MMSRGIVLSLLLASSGFAQRAVDRPVRELLIESTTAVVVVPVDDTMTKFKVTEVLSGDRLKPGAEIECPALTETLTDERGPGRRLVASVMLFGEPGEKPSDPFVPLPTGVRLITTTNKVWQAVSKPTGGFRLVARPTVEWERLVRQLRADRAELLALEAIRDQPPGPRRNRALLTWLERHPPGPTVPLMLQPIEPEPVDDFADLGWGERESEPVRWILRTGSAEDSWEAIALYARLHGGAILGRDCYPFATPEGRAMLLRQVKDERGLGGDALRALRILAWPETVPTANVPASAFARPMSETESTGLIGELRPLLTRADVRWQQAVARALVAVVAGSSSVPAEMRQGIVTDLTTRRKATKPGSTNNVLAEAQFRLTPEEGRQPLALLLDLGRRESKLYFWLAVYPEGIVKEVPTLLIEQVAADGKTEKTLEIPLPATLPPDWMAGWDTRRPLFAELPLGKLKVGMTYRMTVSVTTAGGKVVSEPRTFQLLPNPTQPTLLGRFVVDEE